MQDGLVQLGVGQQPRESGVLLLQVLEPPGLVHLHTALLALPAVVGVLGDREILADLGDGRAFGQLDLRLAEL